MVKNIEIAIEPIIDFFAVEPTVTLRHAVRDPDTGTLKNAMSTEAGDVRMARTEAGTIVNGSGRSTGVTLSWATHTGTFAVGDTVTGDPSAADGLVVSTVDMDPGSVTVIYVSSVDPPVVYDLVDELISTGAGAVAAGQLTAITPLGIGPVLSLALGGGSVITDTGVVRAPYTEAGTIK